MKRLKIISADSLPACMPPNSHRLTKLLRRRRVSKSLKAMQLYNVYTISAGKLPLSMTGTWDMPVRVALENFSGATSYQYVSRSSAGF